MKLVTIKTDGKVIHLNKYMQLLKPKWQTVAQHDLIRSNHMPTDKSNTINKHTHYYYLITFSEENTEYNTANHH